MFKIECEVMENILQWLWTIYFWQAVTITQAANWAAKWMFKSNCTYKN